MADAKISQLPVAGAVAEDDLVPIVDTDTSVTKQTTAADMIKDVLNPAQVVLAGDGVDVTYAAGAAGSAFFQLFQCVQQRPDGGYQFLYCIHASSCIFGAFLRYTQHRDK